MALDAVRQMFPQGLGGLSGFSYQPTVAPSAGTLPGAEPKQGYGAYGAVPEIPSPQASQSAAVAGNVSNLANIQQLMAALDQQQAQNILQPFQQGIPNWSPAMGQAMGNVTQGLGGVVNSDVWTNLQRAAAERGIGMGSPLSPNAQTNLLQMLGLTSYGVQQDALKNLLNIMGSIPRISPFNPAEMLMTPAQQQEWQYMANLMRAAPDPYQAATANLGALTGGISGGNRGGYYQPSMVMPSGMPRTTTPYQAPVPTYQAPVDYYPSELDTLDQPGYEYDPYADMAGYEVYPAEQDQAYQDYLASYGFLPEGVLPEEYFGDYGG